MKISKLKGNSKLPQHIAFIIDGNGRWAKKRGLPRSMGHKVGAENVKKHIEYAMNLGIPNISFYCFSSENWNRPQDEVDYLMTKFDEMLDDYRKEYLDKDVRILISGDLEDERLPQSCREKAKALMEDTKSKTKTILNICLNYGGRQELTRAINKMLEEKVEKITMQDVSKYLYTGCMLPLDYIIRTSGEHRTSNFMPWQSVYSEWDFPKKLWPDYNENDLCKSLVSFMKRDRRFGGIKK